MAVEVSRDGFLSLLDDAGNTRSDLRAPDGELGDQIRAATEDNDKDVMCTVLAACGEEAVVAVKANDAGDN